ncbi:YtpR family tRNA-binding protein [Levilactobacillus bambusae]|uniref:tRNA-binding protein n=1 Tax=Levilactobacillus bambusae TaxID=2024736 RepID=A0A2V1N1F0_9LACO|nr:DUF4479 and tRNA-binding domain-containing protein [Levilactobacillus bambusae]PWG01044.1 tRNA-binding protein [Levilactobacillus bambusae]
MLITSYNPGELGDTLITIVGPDAEEQASVRQQDIVRIYDVKTNQTTGYNFFNVSKILPKLTGNGQLILPTDEVAALNAALVQAGFDGELVADMQSKFIVGVVKSAVAHPKSDHLLVTETEIGGGKTLQIVSGSPNMKADIKVVVAVPGAMMPNGEIIWPGELRGVESNGMICSGRELQIKNAPQRPGALILPDDYQPVGEAFDFERAESLFES